MAYGCSQARGLIGAVAAGLCHSHSNTGSEPCLRPTPQLIAMLDLTFLFLFLEKLNYIQGVPTVAQRVNNLTSIPKDEGSILGLAPWVKDAALP